MCARHGSQWVASLGWWPLQSDPVSAILRCLCPNLSFVPSVLVWCLGVGTQPQGCPAVGDRSTCGCAHPRGTLPEWPGAPWARCAGEQAGQEKGRREDPSLPRGCATQRCAGEDTQLSLMCLSSR